MARVTGQKRCPPPLATPSGFSRCAPNHWPAPASSPGRAPPVSPTTSTRKPCGAFPIEMSSPRALLVSPEPPYPMQGGGAIRTASILEHLARGHDVDVIVFRERGSPDPKGQFPSGLVREIVVLDMPYHRKDLVSRAMRNAGRAVRQVTPLVDRFGGFENEISAVVRNRRYQVTVVEHFWCAPYHEQLAPASEKTILDLHNIESILHERCSGTETGAQALLHGVFRRSARQLEQLWLPRYDTLLTASEHDAQLVRGISCHTDIRVYPNAIPLMPRPGMGERHMIAFSGNLAYHPNVAAVRYFQREIWPILSRRWPSLRWRLIGSHPEAVWNITNGDERIEFSGPIMNAV